MVQTITLSESAYKDLVNRLSRVEKMLVVLTEKLEQEPPEGTEAWWEVAHKKGLEAKAKGEFTRIKSQKELKAFFKSL